MKPNIGTWDRLARIVVGALLMALAATGSIGGWGWLGIFPVLTAVVRFCPLYPLLGISTCSARRKS